MTYYEAAFSFIITGAADCCKVVNHEVHHPKTPTIMSKRRKPATPQMARQRSFCQKEKKRGVLHIRTALQIIKPIQWLN